MNLNKLNFIKLIISLTFVLNIDAIPISDSELVSGDARNFRYIRTNEKSFVSQSGGILKFNHPKRSVFNEDGSEEEKSNLNRQKRYTLLSSKWPTTSITYRFDNKDKEIFVNEEANIRRIIREAFNVWEKDSILHFTELREGTADIMISFEELEHTEIDPNIFGKDTMGHSFQPGSGIGGDIHLNILTNWDFGVSYDSKPQDEKTSLFTVLLHYIGHSLGLGHAVEEESVMSRYYSKRTLTLSEDDIRAIQHIYGVPSNRKYNTNNRQDFEDIQIWA
ncbi:hypothetical protein ACKWTF_013420 [Chironomus riparius]